MLKRIEEYGKYVEITGFRNIQVEDAKSFLNAFAKNEVATFGVQLYDADKVATWQHLYFAALNALMAFRTKHNISKSIAVETVLFASAQRQIKKALDLIGVKPETKNIAVMIIAESPKSAKLGLSTVSKLLGVEADEGVLDLSQEKIQKIKKAFEISIDEFETFSSSDFEQKLVDIVVERVALLSTKI